MSHTWLPLCCVFVIAVTLQAAAKPIDFTKVTSELNVVPNSFIVTLKPGMTTLGQSQLGQLLTEAHVQRGFSDFAAKKVVDGPSLSLEEVAAQDEQSEDDKLYHSFLVLRDADEATLAEFARGPVETAAVSAELQDSLREMIVAIEPNYILRKIGDVPAPKFDLNDIQSGSAYWHLDRLDGGGSYPRLDGRYTYTQDGSSVTTFVLDSGVRTTHQEFGGRATFGVDTFGQNNQGDCDGHGSHVAGLVASASYGSAKAGLIRGVRVLDCDGTGDTSNILAGLLYVRTQKNAGVSPAIAVMSLGGDPQTALDTGVSDTVAAGVTVVVAAGNENANACNYSPSRVPAAITVGATDPDDFVTVFTNFGSCVDLYAPGQWIKSLGNNSDTATEVLSGTSMACPIVAGLAALILDENNSRSPATVSSILSNNGQDAVLGLQANTKPLSHSPFIDTAQLDATDPRDVLIPNAAASLQFSHWLAVLLVLATLLVSF